MSRRKRRRTDNGGSGWLLRVVIGLLAAAVLLAGGGYLMLRSYLHSDGFRKFLSGKVSRAADVTGGFSGFRWDGLAVDTESYEATGDGPLARVQADGVHTEIGFGGVKRGVWELKGTRVKRLDLLIDTTRRKDPSPPDEAATVTKKERPRPWYPSKVEVDGFEVAGADVTAVLSGGKILQAEGLRLKLDAEKTAGNYRAEVSGGRLKFPEAFLPVMEIERVKARFNEGHLFITSARAGVWNGGTLEAEGEWNGPTKEYAFQGNVSGISCDQLLSENWAKRVTGTVSSDFTVEGRSGEPEARGSMVISEGVVTALPVLDALAAYADTRRFRILNLDEARSDWSWKKDVTILENLVLSSEGLIRLEGRISIRGQDLDGDFRLGLAPGILASIPGAETDVFTPGERGLLWTPLRITGTVDDPKEDLTNRLIAAAGLRMFEELPGSGEKVLKFSRSLLGESPEETILKGIEAIEKTEDVVREARDLIKESGGLLEGIFGGGSKKDGD